mmetsp:Transcript_13524/g.18883  ORF Transcript_13524/g.18883 Transcript_13524/m.18883 type:complete len:80 (-) Transcript_13524:12-251(-)
MMVNHTSKISTVKTLVKIGGTNKQTNKRDEELHFQSVEGEETVVAARANESEPGSPCGHIFIDVTSKIEWVFLTWNNIE